MPNKYHWDFNAPPPSMTKPTPRPGTKGVKEAPVKFTPVSEEPKKGV